MKIITPVRQVQKPSLRGFQLVKMHGQRWVKIQIARRQSVAFNILHTK